MSWVLITGAAKGLGKAIALALASQNHNIIIHYRNSHKEAENTAYLCQKKGVKAEIYQAEINHLPSILNVFPDIYGLVNNVGHYLIKPLQLTTNYEWLQLLEINVNAPLFLTMALLPSIKMHKGRVINIGTTGLFSQCVNSYCPAYEISKSILLNLTRTLAKETAADNMTVNMISPGIMTNSIDKEEKGRLIPAQRLCAPEEVARIAAFLFQKESSYITGQNIEVSGGFGL